MIDNLNTAAQAATDAQTVLDGLAVPSPTFTAAYPETETRVYRKRLHRLDGGLATATYRGDIHVTDGHAVSDVLHVKRGRSGISLYAEVTPTDDTATTVTVAVVPTGKRTPRDAYGERAVRLGSVGGRHVYLIDTAEVDRATYDAESAARAAVRQAAREAAEADAYDDEYDLG